MTHFFSSLITFFIAIFFILLGFIGILLPWFPSMQELVLTFLFEYSKITFLFGLSFLAIGIAVVLNISNGGRRYYQFKIQGNTVSVDTELLQNYLQTYLSEIFPAKDIPCLLQLKKNTIHITIDLPFIEPEKREDFLEKLRYDLRELFSSLVGYEHEFYLSASFQTQ